MRPDSRDRASGKFGCKPGLPAFQGYLWKTWVIRLIEIWTHLLASSSEVNLRVTVKTYVRAKAFGQIWKASEQHRYYCLPTWESWASMFRRALNQANTVLELYKVLVRSKLHQTRSFWHSARLCLLHKRNEDSRQVRNILSGDSCHYF
jgi:hypothetical protein